MKNVKFSDGLSKNMDGDCKIYTHSVISKSKFTSGKINYTLKLFRLRTQSVLLTICLFSLLSCTAGDSVDKRPNIIYIMVDDMGYADLSSYGKTDYKTPVMDAFINEGMKFTHAYSAAAICTPTRVGLMTGRYPARNEIGLIEPLEFDEHDSHLGLSPDTPTLSSLLKESGYETALFGKWHLGAVPEFFPGKHGFDNFFGITAGAADYIDHKYFADEHILYENDQPVEMEGYLTDLITDFTVDFIGQKHEKPFFISLQYTAPHWPWQVPGDEPYPLGETWEDFARGGSQEIYAAMMKNLDLNIGRILKAIEEKGLFQSTVIIFTSDNGGVKFSDMTPFQGSKGNLYEGGIRVPAAVRWPGIVPPGSVSEQAVITMDWTVTMFEIAEASIPEYLSFDGISLVTYLKGNMPVIPRKMFWRIGRQQSERRQDAYRDGDWKYLKTIEGEFLFNLIDDPGETRNLKETYPEIFTRLKKGFKEVDSQMLERLVVNQ